MTEKKMRIKPTRRPRSGDLKGAAKRAREFADQLRAKYPDREFSDSAQIIREDRDTRD